MIVRKLIALAVCFGIALIPALAEARAGGGGSMGSRGFRTYSAPAPTRIAPSASPIERSVTPTAPAQQPGTFGSATPQSQFGQPQPGFAQRNSFLTGFAGGLIGAGIGGMLFGHGFGGMGDMGVAGGLGLLFQLALLAGGAWFLMSFFRRRDASQPVAYTGATSTPLYGLDNRGPITYDAPRLAALPLQSNSQSNGTSHDELGIGEADFKEFERLLTAVQHAWSTSDIAALRRVATPEMLSYFSEQLAVNASKGETNTIDDVKLEQGELAEAWNEGPIDYATVSMAFSALDYNLSVDDGRVVSGSKTARERVTETWTFMRQAPGGRWLLSAIQQ